MASDVEDLLPLSGLQHYGFCRRQWALIHLEQQWEENLRTAEGRVMHNRAHDANLRAKRGDVLIIRELSIVSHTLGLSGKCDVVEFHLSEGGISLSGEEGRWQPFPVEYKRGEPKEHNADKLQLCAQAMCLEEMLCCSIPGGALYYGETRRRLPVAFNDQLRKEVTELSHAMHETYQRGHTPKAKPSKGCTACSLKDICLPRLSKKVPVSQYLKNALEENE